MADIDRYRLPESTETRVVLRGTDTVAMTVLGYAGIALILAGLYPIYYLVAVRMEVGAAVAALVAIAGGLAMWFASRAARARPRRRTVVDLAAQQLWTETEAGPRPPLNFTELGTLKLGALVGYDAQRRRSTRVAAVVLSKHEDYLLYVPWNDADMVRYVKALRALVGEEHLPRAKPGGSGSAPIPDAPER